MARTIAYSRRWARRRHDRRGRPGSGVPARSWAKSPVCVPAPCVARHAPAFGQHGRPAPRGPSGSAPGTGVHPVHARGARWWGPAGRPAGIPRCRRRVAPELSQASGAPRPCRGRPTRARSRGRPRTPAPPRACPRSRGGPRASPRPRRRGGPSPSSSIRSRTSDGRRRHDDPRAAHPGACRTTLSSASWATRNAARSTSRGRAPAVGVGRRRPRCRRARPTGPRRARPATRRRPAAPSPRGRWTAAPPAATRPRRRPPAGPRPGARPCRRPRPPRGRGAGTAAPRRGGRRRGGRARPRRPRARPASRPGTSSSTKSAGPSAPRPSLPPRRPAGGDARPRPREGRPQVPRQADREQRAAITASQAHSGTPPRSPPRVRTSRPTDRMRPRTATVAQAMATTAADRRPSCVAYAAAMAGGTSRATTTSALSSGTDSPPFSAPHLAHQADRPQRGRGRRR